MSRSKSLVKRNTSLTLPKISLGTVAIIALVGIVIFLIMRSRSTIGIYQNEESYSIEYGEDGLPTKIIVHRDAKRS